MTQNFSILISILSWELVITIVGFIYLTRKKKYVKGKVVMKDSNCNEYSRSVIHYYLNILVTTIDNQKLYKIKVSEEIFANVNVNDDFYIAI